MVCFSAPTANLGAPGDGIIRVYEPVMDLCHFFGPIYYLYLVFFRDLCTVLMYIALHFGA